MNASVSLIDFTTGRQHAGRFVEASAPASGAVITNTDVLQLVRAKMPDPVVLAKIKSSPTKFDTSAKALIALKQAGASDAVILAVTEAVPVN